MDHNTSQDSDHLRLLYDLIKLSKALELRDRSTNSSVCAWAWQTQPMGFIHWACLHIPIWLDCKLSESRGHVWSRLFSPYLGCSRIPIHWMNDDYLLGDSSDQEAISHIHNWDVNHFSRTERSKQTFQDISSLMNILLWRAPLPPTCDEKKSKQAAWLHTLVSAGWEFYCFLELWDLTWLQDTSNESLTYLINEDYKCVYMMSIAI